VGTTRLGVVGLAAAVLTLAALFLALPVARLGAAVHLGSGFLGLAVSLVAVTLGCSGASVTGGGVVSVRGGGGDLDDTPPSDDVIPVLPHVHLLGRRPGPLSFRSGKVACGAFRHARAPALQEPPSLPST
jgi:hypothetical protein